MGTESGGGFCVDFGTGEFNGCCCSDSGSVVSSCTDSASCHSSRCTSLRGRDDLFPLVDFPIEWFQLVPILPPATLPVALVSGHVIASFLPVSFPNSEVETKQTTIGQRWSSSVSPFVAPHTIGHVALRLTATPNRKFCPHMWQ